MKNPGVYIATSTRLKDEETEQSSNDAREQEKSVSWTSADGVKQHIYGGEMSFLVD